MTEVEREREHLALADRHLSEGAVRIAEQRRLLAGLSPGRQEYHQARHLLETLEQTLEQWRAHRDLIIDRIGVLEHRGD